MSIWVVLSGLVKRHSFSFSCAIASCGPAGAAPVNAVRKGVPRGRVTQSLMSRLHINKQSDSWHGAKMKTGGIYFCYPFSLSPQTNFQPFRAFLLLSAFVLFSNCYNSTGGVNPLIRHGSPLRTPCFYLLSHSGSPYLPSLQCGWSCSGVMEASNID